MSLRMITALIGLLLPATSVNAQDAKQIIAAQLRSQGYACDAPQSATRDPDASKPKQAVWIVVCENGTYRATLIPNMAAHVEQVTPEKSD
jgi:hypothetical protein